MCPKSQKIRVNHKNTSKIRVFFLKYSYIRVSSYKYERLCRTGIAMLHPFLRACCMQFVVLKQRYEYEKVRVQFRRYSHMTCKWDLGFGKYFPHFLQSIFLNFRIFLTFLFSPSTNFFETVFLIFEVIFLTFLESLAYEVIF